MFKCGQNVLRVAISLCSNVAQDVTCCQYVGRFGELDLWLCILSIYFIISFMYLFYADRIIRVTGTCCPDITVRNWPVFLHWASSVISPKVHFSSRTLDLRIVAYFSCLNMTSGFRFSMTIGISFYHINILLPVVSLVITPLYAHARVY